MRFYEFATPARPVLKISQQAQSIGANTPPTPLPRNTPPTLAPAKPIKVYPRARQRDWLQRYLAAKIVRDTQSITPAEDDITIAFMRYAEMQIADDEKYQRSYGKPSIEELWVKQNQSCTQRSTDAYSATTISEHLDSYLVQDCRATI